MAIQKRPTGKQPAARPSTSKMPAAKPGTGRQRAPTGQHATQGRGGGRVAPAKKGNTGLIIGASVGGGVLILVLVAIALSGNNTKPTNDGATPSTKKEGVPADVRGMTEKGMRDCEEGYVIIQSCKGEMEKGSLGATEKAALKGKLEKGVKLIDQGMHLLEQAREKGGDGGDPKREWGMARKTANNYIANLGK